jgi:anti-sigma B factor antagonist
VDICATQIEQTLIVSIEGSVDALTAEQAADFLRAQVDAGQTQFVLDLSQVDFLSSSGLRVILEYLKKSRERGGDLRLTGAQPGVGRTLEISGLVRILQSYPSVDEAVASLES